jgi:hypothetical protein
LEPHVGSLPVAFHDDALSDRGSARGGPSSPRAA